MGYQQLHQRCVIHDSSTRDINKIVATHNAKTPIPHNYNSSTIACLLIDRRRGDEYALGALRHPTITGLPLVGEASPCIPLSMLSNPAASVPDFHLY